MLIFAEFLYICKIKWYYTQYYHLLHNDEKNANRGSFLYTEKVI